MHKAYLKCEYPHRARIRILKKVNNPLILLFLAFLATTCIDPFNPKIKGQESILVVDGLLTDENLSYTVKLMRTTRNQNEDPLMVGGARVWITDQDGTVHNFTETAWGIYKSDSLEFRAADGNSYQLHIQTPEGNEYLSENCVMYPVSPVDSIYFRKDQEIENNNTEIVDGIRIFLDSQNSGGGDYFRWSYDEWWKFSVPYPKRYDYVNEFTLPDVDTLKQVCYAHNRSSEILIHSAESSQSTAIEKKPVLFVGSAKSDRLKKQYCIEIRQYSLSQEEFQFWEQLKELNEGGGDIFDKQPFAILGNIHGITDPSETVLGYFQVSAVQMKRLYITPAKIEPLDLPEYSYGCEWVEVGPGDYPGGGVTFDMIYASYTRTGYVFIQPVYNLMLQMVKMVFTRPECAICTFRGSLEKPDWWTDL